jgi:hypothetical protein
MLSTRIELAGALILEAVLTANNALTVGCNAVAAIPFFTKWRNRQAGRFDFMRWI